LENFAIRSSLGSQVFLFIGYTKQHHFGKKGNPNLSQNDAIFANAFICFFFSSPGGYFRNLQSPKQRSFDFSIRFDDNN
jgi:hypothetical protein